MEGLLHCKEFGKKSWSKKFIFLRGSGLYSSSKGKSKVESELVSFFLCKSLWYFPYLGPVYMEVGDPR